MYETVVLQKFEDLLLLMERRITRKRFYVVFVVCKLSHVFVDGINCIVGDDVIITNHANSCYFHSLNEAIEFFNQKSLNEVRNNG